MATCHIPLLRCQLIQLHLLTSGASSRSRSLGFRSFCYAILLQGWLLLESPLKKKPGYDRAEVIDELLVKTVELFGTPFDDRKERPEDAPTIVSVADALQITPIKVRKMLITAGYYSTAMSRRIQACHIQKVPTSWTVQLSTQSRGGCFVSEKPPVRVCGSTWKLRMPRCTCGKQLKFSLSIRFLQKKGCH